MLATFWNNFSAFLIQATQLILGLSLLVFVHEMGHFLFARLFGMRVDKFYLFFDAYGRALWRHKSKRSGTEYGMGWLPLGGYCKIAGMIDESYFSDGKPSVAAADEYRNKPAWQRLLVMLGGVLFNFVLALLIYTGIAWHWGDVRLDTSQISAGMVFSPAAQEVGFRDGDIILTVDGAKQDAFSYKFMRNVIEAEEVLVLRDGDTVAIDIPHDMMQRILAGKAGLMSMQVPFVVQDLLPNGHALHAGVKRGDRIWAVNETVTPDVSDVISIIRQHASQSVLLHTIRGTDSLTLSVAVDTAGMIGISGLAAPASVYPVEHLHYNLISALPAGWQKGISTLSSYARDMKYVFTKEGASQMGGFISIGKLFPNQFSWYTFWQICALLSIVFAFMNFLPIPALDGGHIMFLLWELISRKKPSDKVLVKAQLVGLLILGGLLLYANLNDIIKLF